MTVAGWILLVLACGGITIWVTYCYLLILRTPGATREMHAPLDIDTQDEDASRSVAPAARDEPPPQP